jgi:ABC-type Fe3+ transport system permease subunit
LATTTVKTEEMPLKKEKSGRSFFQRYEMRSLLLFAFLMIIFSYFMFLPILSVTVDAFNLSDPANLFEYFIFVFESPIWSAGVYNGVFIALTTTIVCCLIGITVTIIISRYNFFGKRIFTFLAIIPLISPPFVGAFAVGRLLERNGIISNLLGGIIPGLPELIGGSVWGIIFIQSIHLWPLVYFNTTASYSKIDPAQEEQARNLGGRAINLYKRIIIPLITPGLVAGATLVFIFAIGDIGTPLVLNPEIPIASLIAFNDINERSRSLYPEASFALVIVLLVISLLALLIAAKFVGMRDYSTDKVSGMDQKRMIQHASKNKTILIWIILLSLMGISLLPHFGIILVAFVERIKFGEIIPTLWNFEAFPEKLSDPVNLSYIFNSLLYAFLAMIFTIVIGVIIAYLVVRKKHLGGIAPIMAFVGGWVGLLIGGRMAAFFPGVLEKQSLILGSLVFFTIAFYLMGKTLNVRCLEIFATMPFAVPGIVMAVGFLQFFVQVDSIWGLLPPDLDVIPILGIFTSALRSFLLSEGWTFLGFNVINPFFAPLSLRFTSFWFILVISYTMRRMPYTVLSSIAILRQIHPALEEAAHNLGASTTQAFRKVTFPLMVAGIFAGGVLTFVTSFTEVSTSLIITNLQKPFSPLITVNELSSSDPLTKGIFEEIRQGGGTLGAGVLGLVQLAVAAAGMAIVQKLLGEKTGSAFGGG